MKQMFVKPRYKFTQIVGAILTFGVVAMMTPAEAQGVVTYNVVGLTDFNGPYADIMPDLAGCREGVINWWNDTIGKELKVKLDVKSYNTGYDVANITRMWPGILAATNPVAIMGIGGADTAALGNRLPNDKVPDFIGTATESYNWKPGAWVFTARATYPSEAAAFFLWYRQQHDIKGPLKVGIISSQAAPAYVDIVNGVEHYAKNHPDKVEVVGIVQAQLQPTDLTQQVNELVRKGVQVIQIQTNVAAVVATRRALQALGKMDIPIMTSSHNGLLPSGKAAGGMGNMDGDFEVYGLAIPTGDNVTSRFFKELQEKYGLKSHYNPVCIMGLAEGFMAAISIQNAVKDNHGIRITGMDVRNALLKDGITAKETFDVVPTLKYTNDAPFPTGDNKVNIGTVKAGKYEIAAEDVPEPKLTKW